MEAADNNLYIYYSNEHVSDIYIKDLHQISFNDIYTPLHIHNSLRMTFVDALSARTNDLFTIKVQVYTLWIVQWKRRSISIPVIIERIGKYSSILFHNSFYFLIHPAIDLSKGICQW